MLDFIRRAPFVDTPDALLARRPVCPISNRKDAQAGLE